MKRLYLVAAVLALLGLGLLLVPMCRACWQFDHLQEHARRVITPARLQSWATNLLSGYGTNFSGVVGLSRLGTNFPAELLGLYHAPPSLYVFGPTREQPAPHVTVVWGGGLIGREGFEIGPPGFPGWGATNPWAPGVYFFEEP